MLVYNITLKIATEIEKDWKQWMKEEHIPEVMSSGLFIEYKFYRLLDQDEADGITYIVQYFSSSLKNYEQYVAETAPLLRKKANERWGNQFIAFRTLMQAVD
jgi:hypothetical protein